MIGDLLESMINASLMAGKIIRYHFEKRELQVTQKGDDYDLVTNVDYESQMIIQEELSKRFPGISIIGEEDRHFTRKENAFFVDPLDGTLNFVRQIPFFAVSIGYWEKNQPLCGVVYDPIRQDLFYARQGHGAYLNGRELYFIKNFHKQFILASDWGHDPQLYQKNIQIMQELMKGKTYLFRYMGCASLGICYVGASILDGYWHYRLSPWDMAAAVLIAQLAGMNVSRLDGHAFDLWEGNVLVTSPDLREKMIKVLKLDESNERSR